MTKIFRIMILTQLLLLAVFSEEMPEKEVFTLKTAIMTACEQNPLGQAARFDVQMASSTVKKAIIKKYLPNMDFKFQTGFVPEARGDIFFSPDKQTDLDRLGPFFKLDLELIQPLFTFGKVTSAVNAAREGLNAQESQRDLILDELSLRVSQAYWGFASAQKVERLAADSQESYQQLLDEVQKRVSDPDSEVDDADLLEAKSLYFEVERIKQESIERMAIAKKTFTILLYLEPGAEVSILAEPSPEFGLEENVLNELITLAESARPDLHGLDAVANALQSRLEIAKSERLPNIFLVAGFNYAHAGNRQDQTNPFAVDNFNYRSIGAGIGLKWNPNFFQHNVEIQSAQAEYNAAQEKMKALKNAVGLEVTQAFFETKRNYNLLKAARESLDSTRTWLRVSYDNWEMGIGESWRLIRAYEAYYRMRTLEIEREYAFNTSLAKLGYVLGDTDLYLSWIQKGKVAMDEKH